MKYICILIVFLCLALLQTATHAKESLTQPDESYDKYQSFYLTYNNRLFTPADKRETELGLNEKNEMAGFWGDMIDGKQQSLVITDDALIFNGKKLLRRKATMFPGSAFSERDLPFQRTTFYLKKYYLCVEGVADSATGEGDRYVSVYLFKFSPHEKPNFYKLPRLFNSCLNIRVDEVGNLIFYAANYWRAPEGGLPRGVNFQEYRLKNGKFENTGKMVVSFFKDPKNAFEPTFLAH